MNVIHLVMSGEKVCGATTGGAVSLPMLIEVTCEACRDKIRTSLNNALR